MSVRRRFQVAWLRIRRARYAGVGVFLLGVSAMVSGVSNYFDERADDKERATLERAVDTLSEELTCRSRANVEANTSQGAQQIAISEGLVALASRDRELLAASAADLQRLSDELALALDRRTVAIEECGDGAATPTSPPAAPAPLTTTTEDPP